MKKVTILIVCMLSAVSICMGADPKSLDRKNLSIDEVYERFKDPPAEARPFVRWWWSNNQLEEKEILRELDVLKAAGIGGVEINPIASKEDPAGSKAKVLTWRSEEWDKMLHAACKGAKDRGMTVDLIAGSGWPFGGRFLKPDELIMRVKVITDTVKGPVSFSKKVADILNSTYDGYHNDKVKFVNPSISFISVYPRSLTTMEQVKDVTGSIDKEGVLNVELGKGEYVIAYGVLERGFRTVYHGVKGADGPTMDHLRKSVTRSYLNRLAGVEETWKEPLSTYVRAVFCDSIETDGANWTHDMLETFKKRMGYDIAPYLPLVTGPEDMSVELSSNMRDLLRRARHDWCKHNTVVYLSNFVSEYGAFCHEHNLLSRFQAYGNPDYMDIAGGYMIPDIPESNSWLYKVDPFAEGRFTWDREQGTMLWHKYAAAGGALKNKKVISVESMASIKGVFQTSLGSIKQADDMNFICGMTHSVLHGFNYVPPDVGFPGWIRYGTFFSEHNTWWPYLKLWTDYNARLSSVFQETKPVCEIALLGPTPDVWSVTGLRREEVNLTPDYFCRLWESISQLGAGCDYLHEDVIQKADIRNGQLSYGPMTYQMLIVVEMDSMQPETAEAIQRFVEKGGKVIYVNKTPSRSPGLAQAEAKDKRVTAATAGAVKAGAVMVPGPGQDVNSADLRNWTARLLEQAKLSFAMKVGSPRDGLYATRRQAPGHELFFFVNSYRRESPSYGGKISRTWVDYKLGNAGLWRWNPETGERTPYDLPYDEEGFNIDLRPLESILLVTGEKQEPKEAKKVSSGKVGDFVIDTPWTVEFNPASSDTRFTVELARLSDFSKSTNNLVRTFSGIATYKTTFNVEETSYANLRLGWDNDFISEIILNGVKLGVNWYGEKLFDVSSVLRKGSNELTIRYTTTLWNKMNSTQPQPSGLIGPVRLLRIE